MSVFTILVIYFLATVAAPAYAGNLVADERGAVPVSVTRVCGKEWRYGFDESTQPGVDSRTFPDPAAWAEISETCDQATGLCTGILDGIDVTGWHWATIDEIGHLFSVYSPHPGGIATYQGGDSGLALPLFQILGFTGYSGDGEWWQAMSRTPDGDAGKRAVVGLYYYLAIPVCISTDYTLGDGCSPGGVETRVPLYRPVAPVDTDGDGIFDRDDNCTDVANADQRDTNQDGFGNICDPDFNNDEFVDFADVVVMRDSFLTTPGSAGWNAHTDLNGDNRVNFIDLGILRNRFLGEPGPTCQ